MNLIIIDYHNGKITVIIKDYEIVYPVELYEIKTRETYYELSHKQYNSYSVFPINEFSLINLEGVAKHNLYKKPKKEPNERFI